MGDASDPAPDSAADPAAEIALLRAQLAQAHQALDDFRHTVSHDLRAPLRHVRSFIGIAQEDLGSADNAAVMAHLQTAGNAADQLGRMLDAVLELARLGRSTLAVEPVDLAPLVQEARRAVDADAALQPAGAAASPSPAAVAAPAVRVAWQVADDFPTVQADPALLAQVLQRLLSNACKFTRQVPAPTVTVGWRPAEEAGWCELYVRDNGAGFDPRFTDRLFQPFQRLHSAREFEGLGTGLAYARAVVERHGGHIQARGELGQGCEVCFTLPLAPASS